MQDFNVSKAVVSSVHEAVNLFGGSAWRSNRALRAQGERRILKQYPDDPTILWSAWKKRPDVFADE